MSKRVLLVSSSGGAWGEKLCRLAVARDLEVRSLSPAAPAATPPVPFDLAIVDASSFTAAADMPELAAVVTALRAGGAGKIVVISAMRSWRESRAAYLAGADDYRLKSYDLRDIQGLLELA